MNESLVLTLVGPDKPGLVEQVSQALVGYDANWEQSSMSRLGGCFAGILKIRVASRLRDELVETLNQLETQGLKVVIESGLDSERTEPTEPGVTLALSLIGHDEPALLSRALSALRAEGINVEQLDTAVSSAPMSAEMIFKANADLWAPQAVDLDTLQSRLETLAPNLIVEIAEAG